MRQVNVLIFGALSLVATAVVSCKKQVETELEGKWMKMAFVNSAADADSAIWTFSNGNLYIENITQPFLSDTGRYVVVEKNLKNYVRIDQVGEPDGYPVLNGDWKVIQYKKDKLTLAKPDLRPGTEEPSGNILREFVRMD